MGMISTCVLLYAMPYFQGCIPCIFVISMVTRTSMQSRLRNVSDFRDLVISISPCLLLFCCHVNLMLQRDPCIFWRCSVRMFCRYCCNGSIPALVFNYGVPQHDSILLYFCYKIFLADCLRVIQFSKLVVVVSYMLCICSCHGQLHKDAILLQVCLFCHELPCDECIKLTKLPSYYCFCHALFSAKSETC